MKRFNTFELHHQSGKLSPEKSLGLCPQASEGGAESSPSASAASGRGGLAPKGRSAFRLLWALLFAFAMLGAPTSSSASFAIGVSVSFGPPALPVYTQPFCPGPGYIWTPGYWAWDPAYNSYYWVPGTWVMAPFQGALWTPGYWGWNNGAYMWNSGYWGLTVGFYGGIDYGFGYFGRGYEGGYWNHGAFYYNRAVNNVRTTNITNVYNRTVVRNVTLNHISYNGGPGGIATRPTAAELAAYRSRRSGPVAAQSLQERTARTDPRERASVNHGRPAVAATPRPGAFTTRGVVAASRAGAPYHPLAGAEAAHGARPAPQRARTNAQPVTSAHQNAARPPNRAERAPVSRGRAQSPVRNASRRSPKQQQHQPPHRAQPYRSTSYRPHRTMPASRRAAPARRAAPQHQPPHRTQPYRSTSYRPRSTASARRAPAPHRAPAKQQEQRRPPR